jgi:hypothetical protein
MSSNNDNNDSGSSNNNAGSSNNNAGSSSNTTGAEGNKAPANYPSAPLAPPPLTGMSEGVYLRHMANIGVVPKQQWVSGEDLQLEK